MTQRGVTTTTRLPEATEELSADWFSAALGRRFPGVAVRAGTNALMPRWVGYLSIWVAATFLGVFLMPSFDEGPFAWHGAINFYLVLGLFFLWMPVVTWHIVKAITLREKRAELPGVAI